MTSRLFDPSSIMMVPATASSSPLNVTTPWRSAAPSRTSATWRTSTGWPSTDFSTTLPMSSMLVNVPTARSVNDSDRRSMYPPDTIALALASVSLSLRIVSP